MNPARSQQETATLPTFAHSARVVSVTASSVETVETTSTSFMIGAGLKKCIPITSRGRRVARAQAMIGSEDVVVARIAPPSLQISSRFSNSVVFTARSSAIASTTMSTSFRSSSDVVPVSRSRTSALADSSSLPRWIALSSDFSIVARTPSTLACERPTYRTSYPLLAKTSTMPVAIVPVPTTPTSLMSWRSCGWSSSDGVSASGDDRGAVDVLVGVEAAAGLAAEHPGGDHLLEDRRRRVQPVAALAVHRLEDLVRRVEADQVEQRERAHRVAAAEPHRGVDVLAGGVACPRTSRPRG